MPDFPAGRVNALGTTQMHTLVVEPAASGQRLDRFLAAHLPEWSRTRLQALVEAGEVLVDGARARSAARLGGGQYVAVRLPPPETVALTAEPIPLAVIYEDADLLVIDKPAGMVVHPAPGHAGGTLVNAVLARYPDLAGGPPQGAIGGEVRPGIVHRLDRDTSGLIVVAKHERAQRFLAAQLQAHEMDKRYLALADGRPGAASGTIDAPIGRHPRHPQRMAVIAGGRTATTRFWVREEFPRHTLLECQPVTGRTHQIRVHLAAIHCSVVADRTYGRKTPTLPLDRHFLHAARLTCRLPSGETQTFEAPLPPDLDQTLDRLRREHV